MRIAYFLVALLIVVAAVLVVVDRIGLTRDVPAIERLRAP